MLAAFAVRQDAADPLAGLAVGQLPPPDPPAGWEIIGVRAATEHAIRSGQSVPAQVDVVIETVGEATWGHSLRAVRDGGKVVVAGGTSGTNPPADLQRVFIRELAVVGASMGTREDFEELLRFARPGGGSAR